MSAKKPSAEKIGNIPPFGLRMLPDLKSRIEQAAAANGRSLNSEIVQTLQEHYPEPLTLAETVADITQTIDILKRFKGSSVLMVLADQLDYLMADIAEARQITPPDDETQKAAKSYVEKRAKFARFVPPEDTD